ncbi:MAG TPA: energy transducer TonB [Terriglobales bacterium]|nr:energy transducer TonB [Terriglobales bacterium]
MQFTLLNERQRDQGPFGLSLVLHMGAIILAILLPLLHPEIVALPRHHYEVVTLYTPKEYKPAPVKTDLPKPKPMLAKAFPKIEVPKLPQHRPEVREIRAPQVAFNQPRPELMPSAQTKMPRLVPSVKVGVLTGSSAPATVKAPVQKVQTGGFGDENGVNPSPKSDGKGRLVMARLGSFDLPPGPGYGNGSGGAKGIAGTVKSAGFGNSIAGPGQGGGQGGSPNGGVRAAGFTNTAAAETPHARPAATEPKLTPVEIISKPNPIYTQEARDLKLEGEVLLQVVFAATGQLRVVRVERGLGHGLDEAAVRAAQQIRYKPALRDGQPYDSVAIVHVRFQLAY